MHVPSRGPDVEGQSDAVWQVDPGLGDRGGKVVDWV